MNVRLAVAAAAATAGATLLAVSPVASAATPAATTLAAAKTTAPAQLPLPNRALTTTVSVEDAQLTVDGTRVTVDLRGPAGLVMQSPARGRTDAAAAFGAQLTGTHPEFGRITVTTETTTDGRVRYASPADAFPASFDLPTEFTVEIQHPPATATRSITAEPLVLSGKTEARLTGQIGAFPPKGDLYRLQNPVDLVLADSPDHTVATLERFPIRAAA